MSETILARVVHLLTLGAYAWEDSRPSDDWREDGGGDIGSVFHSFTTPPTPKDWVERILLNKPESVMSSGVYSKEHNALQLLHKLVSDGGPEQFKVQDRSIRCGAAWLCEYAVRNSSEARVLLGNNDKSAHSPDTSDSLETDKQRRSREAKERVMKKMQAQMAKFASTFDSIGDSSDHTDNDNKSAFSDCAPPGSPSNSSSMLIDSADGVNKATPKTTDTRVEYIDIIKNAPTFPALDKQLNPDSIPRLFRDRPKCIICADDGALPQESETFESKDDHSDKQKKAKVLTFCGFIQASTVARGGGGVPSSSVDGGANLVGTHISLCGHAIHASCCDSHLNDAGQREERSMDRHETSKRGEFKCPLCRRLTNCLVPFLDVGRGWAFCESESKQTKNSTSTLHDFLDKSNWWAARNDILFVWNGRCSFVPRDLSRDAEDNFAPNLRKAFGKKDLCRAWSTVLWTPTNVRRGSNHSLESTAVTDVWRRILDQASEISYKADSKRIGDALLERDLGEFRHYLVEKVAYNGENLDPTYVSECLLCVML